MKAQSFMKAQSVMKAQSLMKVQSFMRKCAFWRNVQNLCKRAKLKMIHVMIMLSYDD